MHELSIAMQLVEQIVEIAEVNKLLRVDEVELETGILRQVIPEMMQTAFAEATDQTVAQGALLKIRDIPAKARCNQCALGFEPEADNFLCPKCQVADVEVLQGNEIILKTVSCEAEP
ncbi:MAG: hydrogenase maturation nickel metallochaperone HypA [Candidatus Omnitrophica bacterium]|nr:hydrogenase maturation nickel metallochaperone HypA [Candidatus Omnitrophota bacterium]